MMEIAVRSTKMRFLLAFILAPLLVSGQAILTNGPSVCDDWHISIQSQAQLDLYSNCSTLDSPITLKPNFTGAFELPGVVSIGRVTVGYLGPKLRGSEREDHLVTSLSFPDLKNSTESWNGGIHAMYLPNLTDISFPKLENVTGDLILLSNPKLKKASFPLLHTVERGVWIDGSFDEISLPSLKQVGYMNIYAYHIDCVAFGKKFASLIFTETKKPFGGHLGLTCWTGYENNKWNSSDPKYNENTPSPSDRPSSISSSTPVNSTQSSSPPGSAAAHLNAGVARVFLALIGVVVMGTL